MTLCSSPMTLIIMKIERKAFIKGLLSELTHLSLKIFQKIAF